MMPGDNDHSASVDEFMGRIGTGLSPEQLVRTFDAAFAAIWGRAHRTLGDVTLMAITDRVLYSAAEEHPALAGLQVDARGLKSEHLLGPAASSDREALTAGIRFVLLQFLTVLGNLTADILTPALHGELAKVVPPPHVAEPEESLSQTKNSERIEESKP